MILDDRFQVLEAAAAGGMGTVHRGIDRLTGRAVAIKVLQRLSEEGIARFRREGAVLADLDDPTIVSYVGHGTTAEARPYLVMEWLEGEDLGARLARGRLSVEDATTLAERVAQGLATAHARGVVHRDVKPSNVVLCGGRCDSAKLVDFGIARRLGAPRSTGTGHIIGTPGFMAPEQVRGEAEVDARADVFALGALLFEAVSGRAAFAGDGVMAVLAKVLLEEPPALRSLCAVPARLEQIVARMLSKDPAQRPADGAAVLRALRTATSMSPAAMIPTGERTVVTIVAAAPIGEGVADTIRDDATLLMVLPDQGARVEKLIDGTTLHVFFGSGIATDQAARAARCALKIRAGAPGTPIAIATGRDVVASGRAPVGEVLDRVAALLAAATDAVVLDELTAGLLDVRFEIERAHGTVLLGGERSGAAPRRLLGRVSPCVGRHRDLRILTDTWAEAREERSVRVVVVVAPPGTGKSRLAHELVAHLEGGEPAPVVVAGVADPLGMAVPMGMIAGLLDAAAGIDPGDSAASARAKLDERVGRSIPAPQREDVARALARLISIRDEATGPRSEGHAPAPGGFAEDIRRGLVAWLEGEAEGAGLVLILDDVHWCDDASLGAFDAILRELRSVPCLVVALARPEIRDRYPDLFADHGALLLRLAPLGRRACESLAEQMLAGSAPDVLRKIVDLSEGNAFFLEELIRAAAHEPEDVFPETVVAVLDARLSALLDDERRIVRAASILGGGFPREALASLAPDLADRVDGLVADLVRREIFEVIGARGESLVFRHALLREAAYGTLTPADQRAGHAAAAAWLAHRRDPVSGIVAAHHERAGAHAEAASWYRRAAVDAYRLDDGPAIMSAAESAIRCGAGPEDVVYLRSMQSVVCWWSGDARESERWGREALARAAAGTSGWYQAVASVFAASMQRQRPASDAEGVDWSSIVDWLSTHEPTPGTEKHFLRAAAIVGTEVVHLGWLERGGALLERVESASTNADPAGRALAEQVGAWRALVTGDPAAARTLAVASATHFDVLGKVRDPDWSRCIASMASVQLGLVDDLGPSGPARAHPASRLFEAGSLFPRALAALVRGDAADAEALAERCVAITRDRGGRVVFIQGLTVLARALLERGQIDRAERLAAEACVVAAPLRLHASVALATVAQVRLRRGDVASAVGAMDEALMIAAEVGGSFEGELALRLVDADVRAAAGDEVRLRRAVAAARSHVERVARSCDDPVLLASFVRSARVRALERHEEAR